MRDVLDILPVGEGGIHQDAWILLLIEGQEVLTDDLVTFRRQYCAPPGVNLDDVDILRRH
ncbi:MAG: hypothetical protein ACE5FI_18165 [Anaerolineales bacterium]